MRYFFRFFLPILSLGFPIANAQVTTATFYGIVTDPTSAAVAGATVVMTHADTGTASTKITDTTGEFTFTFLPVGSYKLRIEAAGFQAYESDGVKLVAAQSVRKAFSLHVGTVTEQVEVQEVLTAINTVSAEQRESVSRREVMELPLARRNVASAISLSTGVFRNGGDVILNGLGRGGTNITLDGTDASSNPERPSTAMFGDFNYINTVSMEAVEEVQTSKGVVPAEYSRALSGNINVITRSGTNVWQGTVFENFQADELNARNQFLASKPGFTFNQFGGSLGGPIVKNRVFAFGAYEGYQEGAFSPVSANVPADRLRRDMIARVPDYKLFLDTLPLPNQPYAPTAATGFYQGAASTRSNDNHIVLKPDVQISDRASFSMTYTRARPYRLTPNVSPVNARTFNGETDRYTARFTIFGANWSSETRYGYNRNYVERLDGIYNIEDPNKPENSFGGRRLAGITALGFSNNGQFLSVGDPNQSVEQKVAFNTGRHSLKFGGIYFRRVFGHVSIQTPEIRYENEADLLANNPSRINYTFGVDQHAGRTTEFGFFAQDDWRIGSKLVVNLGLRYDFFSHATAHGKDGGPPYIFNPGGIVDSRFTLGPFRPANNGWDNDPLNLGPRVGFSYNPDGLSKSVIRGGFSTLFTPISGELYTQTVLNGPKIPFRSILNRADLLPLGLHFPTYNEDVLPLVVGGSAVPSYRVLNPHISTPYALNFYLGYQRELSSSLMFESGFVGNRGVKFQLSRDYNQPDRLTGLTPNPTIGTADYWDNSESTRYLSWQSSIRKRYSRSLLANAHYTWGKAISYGRGDTAFGGSGVQNFFDIQSNRGPAENNVTHNFTVDFIYELPKFHGNSLLQQVLDGWQVSGVFTARTGLPVNISQPSVLSSSRPDYAGGNLIADNSKQTLQYLNKAAFAAVPKSPVSGATIRPGNLGNGVVRAPGAVNMDLGCGKKFWIVEQRLRFEFRMDMFNAFNHTNFTGISNNLDAANFGRFTSTAGARQIQLNGRLRF